VAAGADGLIIEVHNNPEKALSDGPQSLFPGQSDRLMGGLRIIAPVLGRTLLLARGWTPRSSGEFPGNFRSSRRIAPILTSG
jgi:hypothetical protein